MVGEDGFGVELDAPDGELLVAHDNPLAPHPPSHLVRGRGFANCGWLVARY